MKAFLQILFVTFVLVNNRASSTPLDLREGDIRVELKPKSLGVTDKKWPNGTVPYVINSNYTTTERDLILSAMSLITTKTSGCITFVPKTAQHDRWLSIKSLSGCWSYIGRNFYAGEQELSLQKNGCVWKGTVVHELMHALGFWHEQNRPDRDNFVTIDFANVNSNAVSNFEKYTGDYFGTPYDYYSIMQYDEYAFSTNGGKTIIPKQAGVTLIHSAYKTDAQILSSSDIRAIGLLYQCKYIGTTVGTTTSAPVKLKFSIKNDYSVGFYLYKINSAGDRSYYSKLLSGSTLTITESVGVNWRLTDLEDFYFSEFTVGKDLFKTNNVTVLTSSLDWWYYA